MYKIKTNFVVPVLFTCQDARNWCERAIYIYISFIPNLLTLVIYIPNSDKLGMNISNPIVCRIIKIYVLFDYICST